MVLYSTWPTYSILKLEEGINYIHSSQNIFTMTYSDYSKGLSELLKSDLKKTITEYNSHLGMDTRITNFVIHNRWQELTPLTSEVEDGIPTGWHQASGVYLIEGKWYFCSPERVAFVKAEAKGTIEFSYNEKDIWCSVELFCRGAKPTFPK